MRLKKHHFTHSLTLLTDDLGLHLPLRSSIWGKKRKVMLVTGYIIIFDISDSRYLPHAAPPQNLTRVLTIKTSDRTRYAPRFIWCLTKRKIAFVFRPRARFLEGTPRLNRLNGLRFLAPSAGASINYFHERRPGSNIGMKPISSRASSLNRNIKLTLSSSTGKDVRETTKAGETQGFLIYSWDHKGIMGWFKQPLPPSTRGAAFYRYYKVISVWNVPLILCSGKSYEVAKWNNVGCIKMVKNAHAVRTRGRDLEICSHVAFFFLLHTLWANQSGARGKLSWW